MIHTQDHPGLPPGWLTEAEQECLIELATDKNVLEIGTFLGRSTVVMARVAKTLISVDPHTGSEEVRETSNHSDLGKLLRQPDGSYDSLPACVEYLQHFGVRDRVLLVVARFEELAPLLAEQSFDLVFVDGDHAYDRAYYDGSQAMRLVRPDGHVVFHDHEASWPEVMRAVEDLALRSGRRVVQLAGALAEIAPHPTPWEQ